MKHLLVGLIVVIVLTFVIAGICFFSTAASPNGFIPQNARTMSLICGIICLVLATTLLIVGVIAFRPREDRGPPSLHVPADRTSSIARSDSTTDSGDGIRPI